MFSSASWDFLLSYPKAEYFKRRLQNEAWTRWAKDLEKQLSEVLHMFNRFMKLKYQLPKLAGGVQIRGVDPDAKALVRSKAYQYVAREVNLAVMDIREVPIGKATKVLSSLDQFLEFVVKELDLAVTQPNVWLLICQDKEDVEDCTSFVVQHLKEYEHALSSYVPSKAEMLNNVSNRGKSPHVPLVFLFKKDNDFANASKAIMRSLYDIPAQCVYYLDASRNMEAKWWFEPTELRMEFYLDILRDFAKPEENVIGIYTGAKFMLAAKVCSLLFFQIIVESRVAFGCMEFHKHSRLPIVSSSTSALYFYR